MAIKEKIPWAKPVYWGKEKEYVLDALESSWISGGPYIEKFEKACSDYLDTQYCLAVSNGTAALNLALLCLGVNPGDEIIIPGFGFMAAANIAIQMGGIPKFAEVDQDTWCIDVNSISNLITGKTRMIIPIHTYGNVCEMNKINELASQKNLLVLEDAAESFGSKFEDQSSGCLSEIGIYSFHATKTIATGEGGLVSTGKPELFKKMQLLRSHGMWRNKYYWHDAIGHNFRMTNMQAAFGLGQIEHIDLIIEKRKVMYEKYLMRLSGIDGIKLQLIKNNVKPIIWAVALQLSENAFPQGRDKVMSEMLGAGIETRPGFYTPSAMKSLYNTQPLPISEKISQQVISLPSFPILTDDQLDYICSSLLKSKK